MVKRVLLVVVLAVVWVVVGGCAFHLGADKLGMDWTFERPGWSPVTIPAGASE